MKNAESTLCPPLILSVYFFYSQPSTSSLSRTMIWQCKRNPASEKQVAECQQHHQAAGNQDRSARAQSGRCVHAREGKVEGMGEEVMRDSRLETDYPPGLRVPSTRHGTANVYTRIFTNSCDGRVARESSLCCMHTYMWTVSRVSVCSFPKPGEAARRRNQSAPGLPPFSLLFGDEADSMSTAWPPPFWMLMCVG